ncbi:hypothetical protein H6P81_008331 [Aristolochia fimbriata]|uniref:Uncharacterized protein n=1 Tax=Aristolochia fimbriata TaxID=158543 RepID=A0AAV7F5Z9_ARIFI|nr:hypothetical protein H6P81_008331 [Aristolochia fimbriata]
MKGGLGSFPTGSTSTLSPLAPPFTVDRPSSKLNLSLTVQSPHAFGDFTDFPPSSSTDNWLHLHPPASVSGTDSILGTGYGYSGSQPQRTHIPSVSRAHALPYDSEVVEPNLLGPETYYTPFKVPTEGSAATDFSSKLSAFGYSSKWAGSWGGSFDDDNKDVDSRFQWKEPRGKEIFTNYKTPVSQGLSPVAMAESEETPGTGKKSSFNPFGKTVQLGPRGAGSEWVGLGYPEDNSNCFSSWNGADSAIQESRLPMPGSVPVLHARDHFNPQTSSYARSFSQVDSGAMNTTHVSPEYLLPTTSNLLSSSSYLEKVGGVLSNPVSYSNDELYTYRSEDDPLTLVSGKNESTFHTSDVKKSYSADDHCSKEINFTLDFSNHALVGKPELENPALLHPNTFTFASGVVCHNDSAQTASETSDQINHAVDSPCWKGLPTSQHSPFAVAFTSPYVPSVKEVPFSCASPTRKLIDEAEIVSSPKLNGSLSFLENVNNEDFSSTSLQKPSPVDLFPTLECKPTTADEIKSDHFRSQFGNMVHSYGGSQDTRNDSVLFGNTKGDLETVPVSAKVSVVATNLFHCLEGRVSEGSFSDEHVSSKSSSGVRVCDETKLVGASDAAKSCPAVKVDAQVLVKMLHNLSELLLSGHFSDIKSLQEPDYETLDHVIKNLSTFALVREVREPFLEFGGSNFVRKFSDDPQQGIFSGKYPVARSGYDSHNDNQQRNSRVAPTFDKKVNCVQGSSFESKVDSQKDIGITQALKKALNESVCSPEESSPQTMLYKNLWIEAEAAICRMKYEVQLERMKMVMEGNHYSPAKASVNDASRNSTRMDKDDLWCENTILAPSEENKSSENTIIQDYCGQNSILRDNAYEASMNCGHEASMNSGHEASMNSAHEGSKSSTDEASMNRAYEARVNTAHEASMNNKTRDVDSSVLARFRILMSRIENSSSAEDEGKQQISTPVDIQGSVGLHETSLAQSYLERKPNTSLMDETVLAPHCFETKQDVGATNNLAGDPQNVVSHHLSGNGMSSLSALIREGANHETVVPHKNLLAPKDTAAGNPRSQLLVSGSNSSGSDWEHVLKEDISCLK